MKSFIKNHPTICFTLSLMIIILATQLVLLAKNYSLVDLLTKKIYPNLTVVNEVNNTANIITGKVVEVKDKTIKIETQDSYFTVQVSDKPKIEKFNNPTNDLPSYLSINELTIGQQIEVHLETSKYLSTEPFPVDYIIVK